MGSSRVISSKPLPWAATVLLFTLFLSFFGLGRIPFYTKGEPREAVQVWEEVHSGEWVLPMRNGREVPSKPPLFHWLGGVTSFITGHVDEFSIRFPSALLATLSVLLVFWLGLVKWGTSAGVFAAFVLATNFEWMRAATTARVDMSLTAFLIGAFVALDRVVSMPAPSPRALLALYACMGFAALGKGPVGILLPALVALVFLAVRRDLGRLRRMRPLAGGALTLVIAGSWYVAAIVKGGEAFVYKQLFVENVGRFFAADASGAGHVHSFYYLIGGFFTGFAPWSFFVIPVAIHLWGERRRLEMEGSLYLLVWFGVVFVFYSISQSKRTVYLLPLYPAAALLLGRWWSGVVEGSVPMPPLVARVLRFGCWLLAGLVVLVVALLLASALGADPLEWLKPLLHPKDRENVPLFQDLLRSRFAVFLVWGAVLLPLMGLLARGANRGRWGTVFACVVAFVASTFALVNGVLHPELARGRSFKPFMEIVRSEVGERDRLFFFRAFDYGAVFYARRRIPPLEESVGDSVPAGQRSYALLWESQWDSLPAARKGELQFLHRSEGTGPKGRDRLVLVQIRPGATLTAAADGDAPTPSKSLPSSQEQADTTEEEE